MAGAPGVGVRRDAGQGGAGVGGSGGGLAARPRAPPGPTLPPHPSQLLFLPYEAGADGATAKGLREAGVGDELTAWLTTEMAQNRVAATAAAKAYPYAGVDAGATVTVDGHDVRGTAEMIRLVEAAPAAGLPFPRRGGSGDGGA